MPLPPDYMFQLSAREPENLRSQLVMSKPGAKMGLRRAPFALAEHSALMAAFSSFIYDPSRLE